MSKFKVEVIADRSGEWCGNGLRFETTDQAEVYARDLASRWTLVERWRIVGSWSRVVPLYVPQNHALFNSRFHCRPCTAIHRCSASRSWSSS